METYAKLFFDVPKALEPVPELDFRGFQQVKPVVIAVTDATQVPAKGTLRKISMDKAIFAFLLQWSAWEQMPKTGSMKDTRDKALCLFRRQALHWPMDFVYFEPCPSLEQDIFKASFQIMEDTRREEEQFAPSGWQVCCLFAQARLMKQSESGDGSAQGVELFLKDINFANSSDYKIKAGSKVVEQGLRVYDRFTAAGVDELICDGASTFGRGSPFDQLTKLFIISQKVGDVGKPTIQFILQLLFVRLARGRTATDISRNQLGAQEMPLCLLVCDLVTYAFAAFPANAGAKQAEVLQRLATPAAWNNFLPHGAVDARVSIMFLKGFAKRLFGFVEALYDGSFDAVLSEMIGQNMKKTAPREKFLYPKLRMEDAKEEYERELAQANNAQTVAAKPHSESARAAAPEMDDDLSESSSQEEESTTLNEKEAKLREARSKHVELLMGEFVQIVVRPAMKEGYEQLFRDHALLAQRSHYGLEGGTWRHGWVFDPSLDAEASTDQGSLRAHYFPQADVPTMKIFLEAAQSAVALENDVFVGPGCKSTKNLAEFRKLCNKRKFVEDLNIVYTQAPGRRGKVKTLELVVCAQDSQPPTMYKPRLFYTLTTTATDTIVMADNIDLGLTPRVAREQKEAILGPAGLSPKEANLNKSEMVHLFHGEKHEKVWREICHHLGLTSATVCTPGVGIILIAMLKSGMKVLALAKNQEHVNVLKKTVADFLRDESEHCEESAFFLSRATIIEQLGLEPDLDASLKQDAAVGLRRAECGDDLFGSRETGQEEANEEDESDEDVPAVDEGCDGSAEVHGAALQVGGNEGALEFDHVGKTTKRKRASLESAASSDKTTSSQPTNKAKGKAKAKGQ